VIRAKAGQYLTHIGFVFLSTATFIWLLIQKVDAEDGSDRDDDTSLLLAVIFSSINMVMFWIPVINTCFAKKKNYNVERAETNNRH